MTQTPESLIRSSQEGVEPINEYSSVVTTFEYEPIYEYSSVVTTLWSCSNSQIRDTEKTLIKMAVVALQEQASACLPV